MEATPSVLAGTLIVAGIMVMKASTP